jgi:hypothetical protein
MSTPPESPPGPPPTFFQRRPIRRALRRWLGNWLERHQHRFNRAIHCLGIPLALLAAPVLLLALPTQWYWAALAFVVGYVLQWIGHLVEGNDIGEWAAIKRLLGLPYVAIAPGYAGKAPETPATAGPRTQA